MLTMQSLRRIFLVVGLLLVLVFGPVIFAGYTDLSFVSLAPSAHDQSIYYESAARRLPWALDLYQAAGSAALDANEYGRAIMLFQTARQKSALTPIGQFQLGKAWLLNGDQDQALAEWQGLLNGQAPAAVSASPYLADIYHAQARFDDEERVLRQWLALDPKNADVHYRLGLLLFADAAPEAIPLLEFAAAVSPQLEPAADGLRSALKTALASPSAADSLTYCGQTLAAINEWPLALRAFSRAVDADANNALTWAWLGETRQQTPLIPPIFGVQNGGMRGGSALDALQRAVTLAPDSAQIRAMFGLYWQRQRDWQKALAEFEAAARLEPQNAIWQVSLGDVTVRAGNLVTALTYYQNAASLGPKDPQTWRALALFSVENDVDIDGIGREAALQAYALEPENAHNMDILGRALTATGQYDAAEVLFKKALAAAPRAASPAFHLALLYLQTDKADLAKQYLQSAQALDPDGPIGAQAARILTRYFP